MEHNELLMAELGIYARRLDPSCSNEDFIEAVEECIRMNREDAVREHIKDRADAEDAE